MGEVIHIQVGQCGNRVGTQFLEEITNEHNINTNGVFIADVDSELSQLRQEKLSVYYNETQGGKYVPRALLVDSKPDTMDIIKGGPLGSLVPPENFIHGQNGAGNNWAKGFHSVAAGLKEILMDSLRKESEKCDCLQGFQVVHSLGGGTGSGLGSYLTSKLQEEYLSTIVTSFSVVPSARGDDIVVGPYNTVLSMSQLIYYTNLTFCMDNGALRNITSRILNTAKPSYAELNNLICSVMTGITSCFRFSGENSAGVRKLATSMVPFPLHHLLTPSLAPLVSDQSKIDKPFSVSEITYQIFDSNHCLVDCDLQKGKYSAMTAIFRGRTSLKGVDEQMVAIQRENSSKFVDWMPDHINTVVCRVPSKHLEMSSTAFGNTSAISTLLERILEQFQTLFKTKVHLHHYTGEGMDEMEFEEAQCNVKEMSSVYQWYAQSIDNSDDDD